MKLKSVIPFNFVVFKVVETYSNGESCFFISLLDSILTNEGQTNDSFANNEQHVAINGCISISENALIIEQTAYGVHVTI